MKNLVMYYSHSGHSKRLAEARAAELNCEIAEIRTPRRLSKLYTFLVGCPKSIRGSSMPILPIAAEFSADDCVEIFTPIWAGSPAPPVNAALKLIPRGTRLRLYCVSASGESSKSVVSERIRALGLELTAYEDIKSGTANK